MSANDPPTFNFTKLILMTSPAKPPIWYGSTGGSSQAIKTEELVSKLEDVTKEILEDMESRMTAD